MLGEEWSNAEETDTWETRVISFNMLTITRIHCCIIIYQPPLLRHKSHAIHRVWMVQTKSKLASVLGGLWPMCEENSNIVQHLSKPTINNHQTTAMLPANSACQKWTPSQMMMVSKLEGENIPYHHLSNRRNLLTRTRTRTHAYV